MVYKVQAEDCGIVHGLHSLRTDEFTGEEESAVLVKCDRVSCLASVEQEHTFGEDQTPDDVPNLLWNESHKLVGERLSIEGLFTYRATDRDRITHGGCRRR